MALTQLHHLLDHTWAPQDLLGLTWALEDLLEYIWALEGPLEYTWGQEGHVPSYPQLEGLGGGPRGGALGPGRMWRDTAGEGTQPWHQEEERGTWGTLEDKKVDGRRQETTQGSQSLRLYLLGLAREAPR